MLALLSGVMYILSGENLAIVYSPTRRLRNQNTTQVDNRQGRAGNLCVRLLHLPPWCQVYHEEARRGDGGYPAAALREIGQGRSTYPPFILSFVQRAIGKDIGEGGSVTKTLADIRKDGQKRVSDKGPMLLYKR